jgi:hypothetical protein
LSVSCPTLRLPTRQAARHPATLPSTAGGGLGKRVYRHRRGGSLEAALYIRIASLSADYRALLQRLRAFQSIGGELKFPHKAPLNADERVCCITSDRIFFRLWLSQKPKMVSLALSSMLLALRYTQHRAYLSEESHRAPRPRIESACLRSSERPSAKRCWLCT